ncbi:hypothetical protein QYE76_053812 [Lolium multiflorum]|uniref:Transmembrane protein n=1 Tax=Lolium multiflorum TaxID=4521 RepID=A0AAD8SWI3_LOLMU|nr:hypothetical protein QYE76_053812 [Lolium multiflorum]
MVDLSHSIREPGFSFDVNMAGFVSRHGKDKAESSHSRGKDKEEAVPRDRPQDDDRRYLTKEEVRSIRYQRPLFVHLLNKYEQQYDRRRRYDEDDERYRRSDADRRGHCCPLHRRRRYRFRRARRRCCRDRRALVVLIVFAIVVFVVEVTKVARPRTEALGRRLSEEVLSSSLLPSPPRGGEIAPGEAIVVTLLFRFPVCKESEVAFPSVEDLSSSDQTEEVVARLFPVGNGAADVGRVGLLRVPLALGSGGRIGQRGLMQQRKKKKAWWQRRVFGSNSHPFADESRSAHQVFGSTSYVSMGEDEGRDPHRLQTRWKAYEPLVDEYEEEADKDEGGKEELIDADDDEQADRRHSWS